MFALRSTFRRSAASSRYLSANITQATRTTARLQPQATSTQTSPLPSTRRPTQLRLPSASRRYSTTKTENPEKVLQQSSCESPPTELSEPPYQNKTFVLALLLCAAFGTYTTLRSSPAPEPVGFNQRKFSKCTIISKVAVSSTAYIYTIRPPFTNTFDEQWQKGLWSLEFKQPQLQVARSYTPLPPRQGEETGTLRFLIRKIHGGEVSTYISRLGDGDMVEIRGPTIEYKLKNEDRKRNADVVFLAGGTGIASALQAVHCFLSASKGEDKIKILWANRRREDCAGAPNPAVKGWFGKTEVEGEDKPNAIMDEIHDLQKKYPGRIKMEYFVDEEGSFITPKVIANAIKESEQTGGGSKRILMASGPDGFIEYFVGKKGDWVGTQQEQGVLGGVANSLSLKHWEVMKL